MSTEANTDGYDFIIVGSGAGGAPLAARLAQAGKRVLLIEAGSDHGMNSPFNSANEVSRVPGLHGVSTEHEALAWRFFVEHYDKTSTGELPDGIPKDPKRHSSADEQEDGIFYPRSSGVGGCTIHNAMITIAGPDADWDDLADELDDESWRGNRMRAYFQRLEHNDYLPRPESEQPSDLGKTLGYVWASVKWLFGYTPDGSRGKHGFHGWLHTSVADLSLGLGDKQLVKMLSAALFQAKLAGLDNAWTLLRRFLKGEIRTALDPNHRTTQQDSPEGVVMIPVSVHGHGTTIHQNRQTPYAMLGKRSSPRELLHETIATYGARLTIWTDCLVTRVLFKEGTDQPPRAEGVEFLRGKNLYKAHVNPNPEKGQPDKVRVNEGGEVILCGGTFNTPQLLMLSGIGDPDELKQLKIDCRVALPGVGKNLQDRYEVSVVGQMKRNFSLLEHATFQLPEDSNAPDPHLRQLREAGTGLYASNGTVLGIFKRSRPDLPQPDLFMFGVPLEFRGYEVGYSKVQRWDRFTWVVLKSHSGNRDGKVELRSSDPLDRPKINFHYFGTKSRPGQSAQDADVLAIAEGVKFVRKIFKCAGTSLVKEIHPATPEHDSEATNRWIRSQAWGHHACGTCRMGRDNDELAVLDSDFRVRNVIGLRVVDASIFPKIPGYFIVTNIYMASEKAADVILNGSHAKSNAKSATYPGELHALELSAIQLRRKVLHDEECADKHKIEAESNELEPERKFETKDIPESERKSPSGDNPGPIEQPESSPLWEDTVTGLAISGGGIRSATLNLGVLQSLARASLLRKVDFLSTVSGGGYIGSCVGRLYDRLRPLATNKNQQVCPRAAQRVEQELSDPNSPLLDWLRKHGNYIAPQGSGDGRLNFAIFVRNLLSIHIVVGLLIFAFFGLANLVRYVLFENGLAIIGFAIDRTDFPIGSLISSLLGPFFSPWFILVELILLVLVLPRITGYWIVSQDEHEAFKGIPLFILFLISGLLIYVGVNGELRFEPLLIGLALLVSLLQVELAWRRGLRREAAVGTGGVETQRLRTRNYLTYDLGLGLALAGAALVFAIIDTLGHGLQQLKIEGNPAYARTFAGLGASIMATFPVARWIAGMFSDKKSGPTMTISRLLKRDMIAGVLAIVLFTLPLVFYSFTAHVAFGGGLNNWRGILVTLLACLLTVLLAFPSALTFVNRSSLAQTYSARLARAYLGASNPLRRRPEGINVTEVIPGDDVASIRDYKPHEASGPLHIINLTINQTVDIGSRLRKRDRQGENMAVSSLAISVGERNHSRWAGPIGDARVSKAPTRLEPLGRNPGEAHPLVDQLDQPASQVEMLSLRQWIGISGAAVDPGRGRTTNLGTALLMGMVNLRTGHWWDSGLSESSKVGFPDLSFSRRLLYLIPRYFTTQFLLIFEWIARYPGPCERFWHLSDGGFFENTGGYELVRRRLPRIVLCDGSADPKCEFESFADFVRKVRIDFNATVESFDAAAVKLHVPVAIQDYVGTLDEMKPEKNSCGLVINPPRKRAALFWVKYADHPGCSSVLLYVKANVKGDEPPDVQHYSQTHPDFPHEDTADQFFDEAQWESYRKLGEHIASPLFARDVPSDWFWRIKLHPSGR